MINQRYEMNIKLLYAIYGTNSGYKDVSEVIQKVIDSGGTVVVNNSNMGCDPKSGETKCLFVVYVRLDQGPFAVECVNTTESHTLAIS